MKHVDIYTDGACSGNPGVGGWGAILIYKGREKIISGVDGETTNNRMELFAVISALKQLKEKCDIDIYSDSAYVVEAFLQGWIYSWQTNGWRTANNKEVKNSDLWKDLIGECNKHVVRFNKVKGHSDNENNNRCDKLATGEISKYALRLAEKQTIV